MKKPPPFLTPHRFARLLAWAHAVLAWVGAVLFGVGATPDLRRLRRRRRLLTLDPVEQAVRWLVICRTVDLAHLQERPGAQTLHDGIAGGFRRRVERGGILRTIAGSRFRKALKHRDPAQRLQRLLAALADIDAFARRYLVPRALRRLTRLFPVLACAPPPVAPTACAVPEVRAVNTS